MEHSSYLTPIRIPTHKESMQRQGQESWGPTGLIAWISSSLRAYRYITFSVVPQSLIFACAERVSFATEQTHLYLMTTSKSSTLERRDESPLNSSNWR